MEVDQQHITTIRLHDAKGADVTLVKEGHDYHLRMMSNNHVVNIVLGHQDIRKLCQQIVQLDIQENWKPPAIAPPEFRSFFFNGAGPRFFQEAMANWLTGTAQPDGYEKPAHRCGA